jgi:diphthine-ammonia ligase
MELWLSNNKLVYQEVWERTIEQQRISTPVFFPTKQEALTAVTESFMEAMKIRMPKNKFGIFLSGGVDSSLIVKVAQQLGGDFICYTVGYEAIVQAPDVMFAEKIAETFHIDWKLKVLSLEDVEFYIQKAIDVLKPHGLVDSVSVGVGAVVCAAVDLAEKDDIFTFFGGLGAEELFAGYQRHLNAPDVHEECWRGLKNMWTRDLVRDAALGSALGISVLTPFLDKELIKIAMQVPGHWKVTDGMRKVILREAAEQCGVPRDVAWRKKQAAQYGSSFDKAITKLAKLNGFGEKGDYLKSLVR